MSDRLSKSTDRLLTTLAELKTQLENAEMAKDRALESLHDLEKSSKSALQRCREMEESCDQLKTENDQYLQKIARLQSDAGALSLSGVARGAFSTSYTVKVNNDEYVIVRPLSTVGYTSVAASDIHSRQWSN